MVDVYAPLASFSLKLQNIRYFIWKGPKEVEFIVESLLIVRNKIQNNIDFFYNNQIQKLNIDVRYDSDVIGNMDHCPQCLFSGVNGLWSEMTQCNTCQRWYHDFCINTFFALTILLSGDTIFFKMVNAK